LQVQPQGDFFDPRCRHTNTRYWPLRMASVFPCMAFGASRPRSPAKCVFNTSNDRLPGDPHGTLPTSAQIVTMTAGPRFGKLRSQRRGPRKPRHAQGAKRLRVRELSPVVSNCARRSRSGTTLQRKRDFPASARVDTRALTKKLRVGRADGKSRLSNSAPSRTPRRWGRLARGWEGTWGGADLRQRDSTCKEPFVWKRRRSRELSKSPLVPRRDALGHGHVPSRKFRVAAFGLTGAKRTIYRKKLVRPLASKVIGVFPASTTAEQSPRSTVRDCVFLCPTGPRRFRAALALSSNKTVAPASAEVTRPSGFCLGPPGMITHALGGRHSSSKFGPPRGQPKPREGNVETEAGSITGPEPRVCDRNPRAFPQRGAHRHRVQPETDKQHGPRAAPTGSCRSSAFQYPPEGGPGPSDRRSPVCGFSTGWSGKRARRESSRSPS